MALSEKEAAKLEMKIQALQSRVDILISRNESDGRKLSRLSEKITVMLEELEVLRAEQNHNQAGPLGF